MQLQSLIDFAIEEDLGSGDLTTEACIAEEAQGRGVVLAKQELVVCGQSVAQRVFERIVARQGGRVAYRVLVPDGTLVQPGTRIAELEGHFRALLCGERLALNFLMKLSGIATHVQPYVAAAGQSGIRIVDTRKTTPLLRGLEKYAVRCGGAFNHRAGLYDGVMIKDNHIAAVGGIAKAVKDVKAHAHHLLRIEVEVARIEQISEAVEAGADVLLLDNMNNEELAAAIECARNLDADLILEASGNMDPQRIAAIQHLDLNVISVGGVIHQARWVDLSLKMHQVSDEVS